MKLSTVFGLISMLSAPSSLRAFSFQSNHHRVVRNDKQYLSTTTTTTTTLFMSDDSNKPSKNGLEDVLEQLRARVGKIDFSSKGSDGSKTDFDVSALTNRVKEIDVTSITNSFLAAKDNLMSGEFGTRGEIYFAAQAILIVCILIGGVPVIGEPIQAIVGPLLAIGGLAIGVLSVSDLGSSLSPLPVPGDDSTLKKEGLYQYVRHPMYAGLLAFCFGVGIVTDSTARLILTALLFYALDVKATYEEEELVKRYGSDYTKYQKEVTGKFLPNEIFSELTSKLNKNQ